MYTVEEKTIGKVAEVEYKMFRFAPKSGEDQEHLKIHFNKADTFCTTLYKLQEMGKIGEQKCDLRGTLYRPRI